MLKNKKQAVFILIKHKPVCNELRMISGNENSQREHYYKKKSPLVWVEFFIC